MAELAAIIKEVAEQLVEYFKHRRLELGWDDSPPKRVAEHLLPKPQLAGERIFLNPESFPGLRKLLTTLQASGILINEPSTEEYIKDAVEECIAKLNYLSHRELQRNFDRTIKCRMNKSVFNCDSEEKVRREYAFPPLMNCYLTCRRPLAPTISYTSAERIVIYVARMIANLLRLTKNAYVQQNDHISSSVWTKPSCQNPWPVESTGKSHAEEGCGKQQQNKKRSNIIKLTASSLTEDGVGKRVEQSSKGNNPHAEPSHLRNKSGCTLFTRTSSDIVSDPSSNMNAKQDKNEDVFVRRSDIGYKSARTNGHDDDSDHSKYDLVEEVDTLGCLRAQKELNQRVKFVDKHNLRNLLPATPLAKVNTDLSVHRSGSYNISSDCSTGANQTKTCYGRSKLNAFIAAHDPMRIAMESKHADIITNRELLQQAEKYGSPNFVTRLSAEIQRGGKLVEPRVGYWMPKRKFYSLDVEKGTPMMKPSTCHWTDDNTPVAHFSTEDKRTCSFRSHTSNRTASLEMSSSNTFDVSAEAIPFVGRTVPDSTEESLQCTSDNLCNGDMERGKSKIDSVAAYKSRRTKGSRNQPSHPTPVKRTNVENTENLCRAALVTADALTNALGIPIHGSNSRASAGVGEATHTLSNCKRKRKKSSISRHLAKVADKQQIRISSSSSDDVVYRVRIESVRHGRMKQDIGCCNYNADTSGFLNPTPPMSIILRGLKSSSPRLKLISAELARLGIVGGHPVVLKSAKCTVQDEFDFKRPSSVMAEATPKEGCPQVDYFAVVCSALGKIVEVEVSPVVCGVKQSRYSWLIKTITVDELEKNKKYIFRCNRWLTEDERVIECKRIRTTAIMKSVISCPGDGHSEVIPSEGKLCNAHSFFDSQPRQTNKTADVQEVISPPRVTIISKSLSGSKELIKTIPCQIHKASKNEKSVQARCSIKRPKRRNSSAGTETWFEERMDGFVQVINEKSTAALDKLPYEVESKGINGGVNVAPQVATSVHTVQNPLPIFEEHAGRITLQKEEYADCPPESTKLIVLLGRPKVVLDVLLCIPCSILKSCQPSSSVETLLGRINCLPPADFLHHIGVHRPECQCTAIRTDLPQTKVPQIERVSLRSTPSSHSQPDQPLAQSAEAKHTACGEVNQTGTCGLARLELENEAIQRECYEEHTRIEVYPNEEHLKELRGVKSQRDTNDTGTALQVNADGIVTEQVDSSCGMRTSGIGDVQILGLDKDFEGPRINLRMKEVALPYLSDTAMAERLRQIAGLIAPHSSSDRHLAPSSILAETNCEPDKSTNENEALLGIVKNDQFETEQLNVCANQVNNHYGDRTPRSGLRVKSPVPPPEWEICRQSAQIPSSTDTNGIFMGHQLQVNEYSDVRTKDSKQVSFSTEVVDSLLNGPTEVAPHCLRSLVS